MNIITRTSLFAAAALLMVATPDLAYAQSNDFKGAVESVTKNTQGIPQLISIVLYIIGIALVGKGILVGKKYSEKPDSVNGGMLAVLGPVAVGALLIAAPSVADLALNSLNQDQNTNVRLKAFGDTNQ